MKKKIVIASVLKPVDDVRSFWKVAQSLSKTNKYEVNIIANATKIENPFDNINFVPHSISRNSWINRYLIRYKTLGKILKIKPAILIVTDHELLRIALCAKLLINCKIIYDIQENYKLNLLQLQHNPWKKLYGILIRYNEEICHFFIDQFWLAEACYQEQLGFVKGRFLVVQDKAYPIPKFNSTATCALIVFTGTISEYSGIRLALKAFKNLQKIIPELKFKIVGQVHDQVLLDELERLSKSDEKILLNVSKNAVPHRTILEAITNGTLGIIAYQPNPVNQKKTPTKLYEYSRYKLPYLVQEDTFWYRIGLKLGGAIPYDFGTKTSFRITENHFYKQIQFPATYPKDETWEYESRKIIDSIKSLDT